MKPLISVIIPVYNHAHTLESCLNSLSAQTYRPLEIIIVNDGSKDDFEGTLEKILSEKKLADIQVKIFNQANQGAPAARNRGFAKSSGDFVIFWDADIVARPDTLDKLFTALNNHPEASYAYNQFKFGWKKMPSHPFDPELLRRVNYINTASLIRRNDFPGFDESLKRFQDWDLWLTMLENKKTGLFVPEELYRVIVGGRVGISNWLPSFMYKLPWKTASVKKYEAAKAIIAAKHHLPL